MDGGGAGDSGGGGCYVGIGGGAIGLVVVEQQRPNAQARALYVLVDIQPGERAQCSCESCCLGNENPIVDF